MILARLEHRGLERAEVACEVELAVVVEFLVGEDQHGVLGEGSADGGEVVGGERLAEHDVAHFGGEIGGDRLYGDGHGVLLGAPNPVFGRDWTTERPGLQMAGGRPGSGDFMMRLTVWFGALIALLGLAAAQAAPLDNRNGFWSEWSDATFARAASEKKFVIVSLQSWWCPWCHVMNRDTWTNPRCAPC